MQNIKDKEFCIGKAGEDDQGPIGLITSSSEPQVKIPGHPARKNSIFKIKKLLKRFV
jgi:hypothetical protein